MQIMYFLPITICLFTALNLITATRFPLRQGYTVGKVCDGEVDDQGQMNSNARNYYNYLKAKYTNCTYVKGNLIIHQMKELTDETLDFFKDIGEVSGYVRIHGHLPAKVTKLPFPKLSIIRGESLTRSSSDSEKKYSLFIYNAGPLTNLGLTSLQEISNGDVYMKFNARNCYGSGETTDWTDIFRSNITQTADVNLRPEARCPPVSERCHSKCGGYCWGPTENDCQNRNKRVCAEQCDYRCFGSEANQCCRPGCLAGCSGPKDTDCWGCKDFFNDGKCVHECPRPTIYNKATFAWDPNPKKKVSFGNLCLNSCPEGLFELDGGCLKDKCPPGYEIVGNKCEKCSGPCPRVCDWSHFNIDDSNRITSSFLRNASNHNCTTIAGTVNLVSGSFEQHRKKVNDAYLNESGITVEDLKIFETVEYITGGLILEPEGKLPQLKSLSMFRNLKKIGNKDSLGYSLVIYITTLESLGMSSLTEVTTGKIWIVAPKLCYPDNATLYRMFYPRPDPYTFTIGGLQDKATCVKNNQVCHKECRHGCVGPRDSECVDICKDKENCASKCKNFEFEGRCMESCSGDGLFANGTTCGRCHEECRDTCTGPLDTDCQTCKNYRNGNKCVLKCPQPTYADAQSRCQPCNELCNIEQSFGCTGPEATVGSGGCDSCKLVEVSENGDKVERCLDDKCPSGHFSVTQYTTFYRMLPKLAESLKTKGYTEACLKCSEECGECQIQPRACTSCSANFYRIIPQKRFWYDAVGCKEKCDESKHYVNDVNKTCTECHETCKGCTGPSHLDCIRCSGFRIDLNVSGNFECVHECPAYMNYTWFDPKTKERLCKSHKDPNAGASRINGESFEPAVVAGPIAGVVVVLAIAAVVITYCCRQKKRHIEKAKEYELRLYGPGAIEPVTPTDANPDLSRLRLVKESELKRAVIIGSGAFGTVFKGFLIPEGENVKVPVAIKVLIEGTSPSQTTELLDEARVMASVDHPCCIKIIAVCMTAEMMLITPLMPEGCLLSYVKSRAGQLGSKVIINWCAQIARGMEHLQSCGIVHRDLAARNVLVQSETQVKITDFGLAKLLDVGEDYYKADSGKVPVKWMALESIQHRMFNHQTDVWSYGVTIWEILTFGQKPYDGVKARDIALLLERGERLSQPTISTIDMYMIMIKCWMLDANTRPTFEDLTKEFTKMARDPGRYLVIDGDQLKRNPTLKMNNDWLFDDLQIDDEYPNKQLMDADDYLSPSIASSTYPRYENEDMIPPPFEKNSQSGSADNLHSPLRYTSSPTLRLFPDEKLTVDTEPCEDYLQPVSVRPLSKPAVDEDGYLTPQSGYIDVLADERTNIPAIKKKLFNDADGEDDDLSRKPLLGADNNIYLSNHSELQAQQAQAHPTHSPASNPILSIPPLPDGTNPIYMSNNNGSPTSKAASPNYKNIEYVNAV